MEQQPFDPNNYISKVKGRDYLEVKWRIAWMRNEQPDAILETDLFSHEDGRAVMRARVTFQNGASATGWGSETVTTSDTYIEKAETKAIGRALTALGYGTPISADTTTSGTAAPQRSQQRPPSTFLATPAQRSRIQQLATELRLDDASLNGLVMQHTGNSFADLNKRQASGIIELLQNRQAPVRQVS